MNAAFTLPEPTVPDEISVPDVAPFNRAPISKVQRQVLEHLAEHGPCVISWGSRRLHISGDFIQMKQDAEHFIITSGFVRPAKGNYPANYYAITPYGRKCLERGYRNKRFARPYLEVRTYQHSANRDAAFRTQEDGHL